ncbi:hypothetical protein AAZX31_02G236400 [Glycine max]|uniref:Inhibitor I9 domain-containing protein n=2 Tax=Glycine subgen. Soja TaxID=1462606 RepID=A0A0R0L181_SOYBN|nr:hypothetical protein JHK87_005201 [Glycine soja]KAH1062018.1 hypothetical protein GYH30_005163 [Glycine max]KRH73104.1 hypothetical protein GLYMA_02G252100v4 [Glycine max]RZC26681.1 hypothetical protein D0Y65_005034 [Glycine soja]
MHPEKLHQMLCCTATISNGFVARLTNEEATRMKGMDGVVSIIPNRIHSPQTSRSGLPWSP